MAALTGMDYAASFQSAIIIILMEGLISYTLIKVFSGKFKEVSVLTFIISVFLVKFFVAVKKA